METEENFMMKRHERGCYIPGPRSVLGWLECMKDALIDKSDAGRNKKMEEP